MSLTKCPHCKHHNSSMRIYLAMNLKHRCVGEITRCEKCRKKMVIAKKKMNLGKRILSGFMWMFPAIMLMLLVATKILATSVAIILVILYHLICFWYIISFWNYKKPKK